MPPRAAASRSSTRITRRRRDPTILTSSDEDDVPINAHRPRTTSSGRRIIAPRRDDEPASFAAASQLDASDTPEQDSPVDNRDTVLPQDAPAADSQRPSIGESFAHSDAEDTTGLSSTYPIFDPLDIELIYPHDPAAHNVAELRRFLGISVLPPQTSTEHAASNLQSPGVIIANLPVSNTPGMVLDTDMTITSPSLPPPPSIEAVVREIPSENLNTPDDAVETTSATETRAAIATTFFWPTTDNDFNRDDVQNTVVNPPWSSDHHVPSSQSLMRSSILPPLMPPAAPLPGQSDQPDIYLARNYGSHLNRFLAFKRNPMFGLGIKRYVSGILLMDILSTLNIPGVAGRTVTLPSGSSNNQPVTISFEDVLVFFGENRHAYQQVHADIFIMRRVWNWVRLDPEIMTIRQQREHLPLIMALIGNGLDQRSVGIGVGSPSTTITQVGESELTPLSLIHSANADEIIRRRAGGSLDDATSRLLAMNYDKIFKKIGRAMHGDLLERHGATLPLS